MAVQELQTEARARHLQLLKVDITFLLEVLKVNSRTLSRQVRELRNLSMRRLHLLNVKHQVDVDIHDSYCSDDLAFLVVDRMANDAVYVCNASLIVACTPKQGPAGFTRATSDGETISR